MSIRVEWDYLKSMTESDDRKTIIADLMNSYGNDVWNYAFSITRKRDLADDITQDVFLKAYRSLFTLRKEGSLKSWLLTITRNTAYDYRRSAFFRKVVLFETIDESASEPSAEEAVMGQYAVSEIWDLVMKLPVKYREVLILYGHHQLAMKEIASMLGITEGAVKSRLFHARSKIMKMKEDQSHE